MTHGPEQSLTSAQLDIFFDEIARHSGVKVVSASQLQAIIAGGGWETADKGKTYTRETWPVDDYFHAPSFGSPLIDTGIYVGLDEDFLGNPIFGIPDIGAYEFQGTNAPPTVTIDKPTNGLSFLWGASIDFSGTATDAEGGDLTSTLTWTSSIDGNIGHRGQLFQDPQRRHPHHHGVGYRPGGLNRERLRHHHRKSNTPPVVTITGPANGSTVTFGTNNYFYRHGHRRGKWGPDLRSHLEVQYRRQHWHRGQLLQDPQPRDPYHHGVGHRPGGLKRARDSVTITVKANTNTAPSVTINNPTNGFTVRAGTAVNFRGTATDVESGNLTGALVWTSSIDGKLGTGGSFSKALSPGIHTITASATDPGGLTGSASVTVYVRSSVTVSSIGYSVQNNNLQITVALQDNNHNPVSGDSVSIGLYRVYASTSTLVRSYTGITGSNGMVTFVYTNPQKSAFYSTKVTAVSGGGLTWDGITPINIFQR